MNLFGSFFVLCESILYKKTSPISKNLPGSHFSFVKYFAKSCKSNLKFNAYSNRYLLQKNAIPKFHFFKKINQMFHACNLLITRMLVETWNIGLTNN